MSLLFRLDVEWSQQSEQSKQATVCQLLIPLCVVVVAVGLYIFCVYTTFSWEEDLLRLWWWFSSTTMDMLANLD